MESKINLNKNNNQNYDNSKLNIKFYICPECRKHFDVNTTDLVCDNCNISLMNNDEFLQYRVNKVKTKKESEKRFNYTISIIAFSIAAIIIIAIICFISSAAKNPVEHTYECERCHKTFTDSVNTKSIYKTNFCEQCYKDVQVLIEMSQAAEQME